MILVLEIHLSLSAESEVRISGIQIFGHCPLIVGLRDVKLALNDHLQLAQQPGSHRNGGNLHKYIKSCV